MNGEGGAEGEGEGEVRVRVRLTVVPALLPAVVDADVSVAEVGERGRHAVHKPAAVGEAADGAHDVILRHRAIELVPRAPATGRSEGPAVICRESSGEQGEQRPHVHRARMTTAAAARVAAAVAAHEATVSGQVGAVLARVRATFKKNERSGRVVQSAVPQIP